MGTAAGDVRVDHRRQVSDIAESFDRWQRGTAQDSGKQSGGMEVAAFCSAGRPHFASHNSAFRHAVTGRSGPCFRAIQAYLTVAAQQAGSP